MEVLRDVTATGLGGSVDGAGGDAVTGSASGTSGSRTRILDAVPVTGRYLSFFE
jgi:hypothetical protein